MKSYRLDNLIISLNKEGAREFSKVSFPIRYGLYSEIKTEDFIFQFNLNGEIKYIQGMGQTWPHPAEWLKRTMGNDWTYYSSGDYKDIYDYIGEYYFPYLSYPSNCIMDEDPFGDGEIDFAMQSWQLLQVKIGRMISEAKPKRLRDFLTCIIKNDEETLRQRSTKLHSLISGQVTVLPPDTRHVDYEVIPIIIADGCLYDCGFCRVKTGPDFVPRPPEDIIAQIKNLKRFYGQDLQNYNAIFLGQHDALSAGQGLLELAARKAYEIFEFERSHLKGTYLFLFGSVDSMIHSKDHLFETLHDLPFSTFINIGLESNDPMTLSALEKPVPVAKVRDAFSRILEVNRKYEKIEVSANFVFGNDLPPTHLASLFELTRNRPDLSGGKGTYYLSPLIDEGMREREGKKELLRRFLKFKTQSRLPAFLYLIQRL
jgi:hypothetical protein